MISFLFEYNFLLLSLLFLVPGLVILLLRKDLREPILLMSLASIPFAFTEYLFYPNYWEPKFLWNLIDKIGFGIEDIIFVIGLASFSSTAYSFTFRFQYKKGNSINRLNQIKRITILFSFVLLFLAGVLIFELAIIYGSIFIMLGLSLFIFSQRYDLIVPALLGGCICCLIYTLLCVVLMFIYPSIFEITWHTDKFLNLYFFGLPFEELLYGYSSGFIATIFYPYVSNSYFEKINK